ncbi:hypothetical protein C8R47DRAFT_974498, partial [Mycena vitilis]
HKADIGHELLAGAASFAAAHEYDKHCQANGKPQSHAEMKELLAGFAGAFIDREVESRGMDEIAKMKAKQEGVSISPVGPNVQLTLFRPRLAHKQTAELPFE